MFYWTLLYAFSIVGILYIGNNLYSMKILSVIISVVYLFVLLFIRFSDSEYKKYQLHPEKYGNRQKEIEITAEYLKKYRENRKFSY